MKSEALQALSRGRVRTIVAPSAMEFYQGYGQHPALACVGDGHQVFTVTAATSLLIREPDMPAADSLRMFARALGGSPNHDQWKNWWHKADEAPLFANIGYAGYDSVDRNTGPVLEILNDAVNALYAPDDADRLAGEHGLAAGVVLKSGCEQCVPRGTAVLYNRTMTLPEHSFDAGSRRSPHARHTSPLAFLSTVWERYRTPGLVDVKEWMKERAAVNETACAWDGTRRSPDANCDHGPNGCLLPTLAEWFDYSEAEEVFAEIFDHADTMFALVFDHSPGLSQVDQKILTAKISAVAESRKAAEHGPSTAVAERLGSTLSNLSARENHPSSDYWKWAREALEGGSPK